MSLNSYLTQMAPASTLISAQRAKKEAVVKGNVWTVFSLASFTAYLFRQVSVSDCKIWPGKYLN